MSVDPKRKRKLPVNTGVAQSSRGPQKEDSCLPVKNRKLGALSKVSKISRAIHLCDFFSLDLIKNRFLNILQLNIKKCFSFFVGFQPHTIEKFTTNKVTKRWVIVNFQIDLKHNC